jgi:hypothetical protein
MKALLISCIMATVLSCSREGAQTDRTAGRQPIEQFLLKEIKDLGGIQKQPSKALLENCEYQYTRDKGGTQIFSPGDRVTEFKAILAQAFGPPALDRTNSVGAASFNYSVRQSGVAIDCGIDHEAGRHLTHLVILRANSLK